MAIPRGRIVQMASGGTPQVRLIGSQTWLESDTRLTGTLEEFEQPGHFKQVLFYGPSADPGPQVDYNVIWLDDESAIEYDCSQEIDGTDYCIHIMSRTPTLPEEKVQEMLDFAGDFLTHTWI